MNLGQFIKARRIDKEMTQEDLASRIGKNKNFISRLENNKVKSLKDYMIEPLAEALGVPIWALFDGFDENGNVTKEIKQITRQDFYSEVKELLNKTNDLSEQQRKHILNTIEFICDDEKK